MKYVQVVMVPGEKKDVQLDENGTVNDAVTAAGWTTSGYNVTVSDDQKATPTSLVNNGARIVLTRQVKGA